MAIISSTELNTEYGTFTFSYHSFGKENCLTISKGDVTEGIAYLRIHSACIFGEAFIAQDCDCRQQLLTAMKKIDESGKGAIVYLFQEGRGVGLANKIKAVNIQHIHHKDTVEAFKELGFELDGRNYEVAIKALNDLNFTHDIYLMCNNFRKFDALTNAGYRIKSQVKLSYSVSKEANEYLHVKSEKLLHKIDFQQIEVNE